MMEQEKKTTAKRSKAAGAKGDRPKKAAAAKKAPTSIAVNGNGNGIELKKAPQPVNGAKKAPPPKKATAPKVTEMKKVTHEEIARLAHQYWAERGRQHGHDAEDWFRAERELLGKAS